MPTTRKHTSRTAAPPANILLLLGLGTGSNHAPDAELRALWKQWGPQVSEYWQNRFGSEPFVAMIAREENWK